MRNDLGDYPPNMKNWTPAAWECHKRNCVCEGCYYNEFFKDSPHRCQMKAAVLELVKKFGFVKEKEALWNYEI